MDLLTLGWLDDEETSTFHGCWSGFDIIFWVARMIMMTLKFTFGEATAFTYTAWSATTTGKMSKSKGNVLTLWT